MDVVTVPINLTPPSSVAAGNSAAAGNVPGDLPVDTAQLGKIPVADHFAALLKLQIGADVNGAREPALADPAVVSDPASAAVDPAQLQQAAFFMPVLVNDPNGMKMLPKAEAQIDESRQSADASPAAAIDPALLLQQAALLMPGSANVPNEMKMTPKAEAQIDVSVASSSGYASADVKGGVSRQSVAANPAAFAVPEKALEPASDKNFSLKSTQADMTLAAAPPSSVPTPVGLTVQTTAQQNNALPPSSNIPQAVGHSAWGDMLGDRVVWMVGQQHQGVELHLNPPALGPLEVRLSMNDGQANLSFATQHLQVKEAIESATSRLREMLGESGISLGSVSVNVGSFTQQQPDSQPQTKSGRSSWADAVPAVDFSATRSTTISLLSRNGMVDVFA